MLTQLARSAEIHLPRTEPLFRPGTELVPPRRGAAGALHVLIVEDDTPVRQVCAEMAGSLGCEVATADSVPSARNLLAHRSVDIVLLDLRLPGGTGTELFEEIRSKQPRTQVIVMTAYATVSSAVEIMRNGACDLLQKPFGLEQISSVLTRASERRHWSEPSRALEDRLSAGLDASGLIGASEVMRKVLRIISKVAFTRHPVLIQGETGTGKEMVARSIHGNGPFPTAPFVPVDCLSLDPAQLESELFGTGPAGSVAGQTRTSLLLSADHGTVFLDEIGHLQPTSQLKLLRALQDKRIPVAGEAAGVRFESRLLASSSHDLEGLVETGRFRKDLFYRLNVVNLRIPPLRERAGDISLLAEHFIEAQRRERSIPFAFSDEALRWMEDYVWPGNVRELESVVERACALSSNALIHLGDLPTQLQTYAHTVAEEVVKEPESAPVSSVESMQINEKRAIVQALNTFQGDKIAAARALGIGKTTLYRKIKNYRIGTETS